ncbi:E6 [Trichechus manatus latirostris papillomavirus 1]|uniref:Protein E6 n=2 Tax=Papillomaviridae TaxID=151340 RepID=Q5UUY5_9PAPI|nr:E6 [Trichechus manatus latirostris papillomavirus 1]AAV98683.1 E6 oncoprotein [Florida manatee papillomavirus]AAU11446.1 E6 [Trichechus manatus latirostris papillomavirus 1]AAV98684.1 E6 oncoprotein [Florida manatee papillomavirus]AAV98685.1 E6 oncoprotein [Florida manatee papillomavirus]AAZ20324.1 E6 protein [Florida manatee papillomavirus]
MEPRTLQELGLLFGITFGDLYLPCAFCNDILTFLDKSAFAFGQFTIAWRDGYPYGICRHCARTAAAYDMKFHLQKTVCVTEVESVTGIAFRDINVRCSACLRTLLPHEKGVLEAQHVSVHLIRNRWLARCTLCLTLH